MFIIADLVTIILIQSFIYVPTLYVRAAKALTRLRICTVSSEPSLLANAISTKFSYDDQLCSKARDLNFGLIIHQRPYFKYESSEGSDKTEHVVVVIVSNFHGSVVECLTRDRGVTGSSLTGVTALCP